MCDSGPGRRLTPRAAVGRLNLTEGRQEGLREAVRRLAWRRFGVVAALEARIDLADEAGITPRARPEERSG